MYEARLPIALLLVLSIVPSFAGAKLASAMVAERRTAQDAANIQVVESFAAAWNDADHGAQYLAPNASARMAADEPPLIGREAYLQNWIRNGFTPGSSVSVKIHDIYARNPLVMMSHTVTIKIPGKRDLVLDVVGVGAVKDGKITEWIGYVLTNEAQ